ncbi:YkyB family protein [Bacillus sp. FJAT-27445]|uniref:YkyB family protein n=1 Tax=Bacillus sp. FJAT-27445 TaxID=1679166 RepID=UPI0007434C6C|nr:YkyB family protein [Bacillus sp. FJAT-27445]
MNSNNPRLTEQNLSINNLSQAIYIVNRHAKTAPNPKFLYLLKHEAIKKLLREGKARKVGLHFSRHPKNSQQQSDVLVECGEYTFHIPPEKKDFADLPHLGSLDGLVRNPKAGLSLTQSKTILMAYTGIKEPQHPTGGKRTYQKPVFKKLGESY